MRVRRLCALLFATAALVILLGSLLTANAIADGSSPRWRRLFRPICHGIEERCFVVRGVAMPICARCTGIYIGIVIGSAAGLFVRRFPGLVAWVAAAPMIVDGATQALALRESTNELRFVTGAIAAAAFVAWALSRIDPLRRRGGSSQERIA